MSDAARAEQWAERCFPRNMKRLMYDTEGGQRVVCVSDEWRDELVGVLIDFASEQTAALRTVVKARIQDEGAYLGLPDDKIDALILAVDRRLLAEAEGRRAEEEWRALKELEQRARAAMPSLDGNVLVMIGDALRALERAQR